MRHILLFSVSTLIYFSAISCYVPTYIYEDVELSDMVYANGVDKDQLYVLANSWFVKHFVSREAVVQFEDKEAGVIVGRYRLIDRFEKPDTYALINMRVGDEKISIRLQGYLKTLESTEKNIKWKENRMKFFEPEEDEKEYAAQRWSGLVSDLASYLEDEIPIMENF